jgi:hypothetical protein
VLRADEHVPRVRERPGSAKIALAVEIPAGSEQAIGEAVVRELERALGARGLLLSADEFRAAADEAREAGARLLPCLVRLAYSHAGAELTVEFGDDADAARLGGALAFGAATARLFSPAARDAELVCATFNLGIGLVDSLCDEDTATGLAVLALVQSHDLAEAADKPRDRGWLRAGIPRSLAADPSVAFTVEIVEVFFELLHTLRPGDAGRTLRRDVGAQLVAALEAEYRSVAARDGSPLALLLESSRLTSVVPFQIIETLTRGEAGIAGVQLGEAMWRIDDLVDLCDDARRRSLNGVLLAAESFDRVVESNAIAAAAEEAAGSLSAGLALCAGPQAPFLFFIQRYAGLRSPRSP